MLAYYERQLTKFLGDAFKDHPLPFLCFYEYKRDFVSGKVYNILLKQYNKKSITKNNIEFIKSSLNEITPYFASYLLMRFKTKLKFTKEDVVSFIGQLDDKDFLCYYTAYLIFYSITKKECDSDEAYDLTKQVLKHENYVDLFNFVISNSLDPILVDCWLRSKNTQLTNLETGSYVKLCVVLPPDQTFLDKYVGKNIFWKSFQERKLKALEKYARNR